MNQLTRDYFDAIELLDAALRLGVPVVRRLVMQVTLAPDDNCHSLWLARPKRKFNDNPDLRSIRWEVNTGTQVLTSQYRVERVEAMACIALHSLRHLLNWTTAEFYQAGTNAGVDLTLLPNPRTRWLSIGRHLDNSHDYALKVIEDRPMCRICRTRPVSSGHARPDQHDNCREFFNGVLLPALREQLARQVHNG